MKATKHRLQSNDDLWHQIWKEDSEGRELPYCEIINTDKETVVEVFRAVHTFDQAREALKLALDYYRSKGTQKFNPYEVEQRLEKALAAMEDAGR